MKPREQFEEEMAKRIIAQAVEQEGARRFTGRVQFAVDVASGRAVNVSVMRMVPVAGQGTEGVSRPTEPA